MDYSEILLGRDSFSYGDRSVAKQCGSIERFLHDALYSIESFFFFKKIYQNHLLIIYASRFVIAPIHTVVLSHTSQ